MGTPIVDPDEFVDHNDPLIAWAARVTRTLTQKQARSAEYNWLDWEGGIAKECGTMKNFGVLGQVFDRDEVKGRRHYNEAQLLGAWAVKQVELEKEKWEARYRCVYGGHQPIRADGSTALYVSSASLPASLRDLRIFTVVASLYNWVIHGGDVTGAYLNAAAPADSFVRLSPEQVSHLLPPEQLAKYNALIAAGKTPVVELVKALYGHTQAGFLWEAEARKQLMKMGFVNFSDVSSSWYCMYSTPKDGESPKLVCMLLLYVDDFLIAGDPHVVRKVVSQMKEIWELKGGDIHSINDAPIIGTQFMQHFQEKGQLASIVVDQRKYSKHTIQTFLETTGLTEKDLISKCELPILETEQDVVLPDGKAPLPGRFSQYGSKIVGGFMWLCRTGVAQLTVAVNNLARHMNAWSPAIDRQCLRLVSHTFKTAHDGVLLLRASSLDRLEKKLKLLVFSDADHAGNVSTRKSVSGCAIFLAGPHGTWALLDWISKTQRTISLSTAEAELLAAQLALRECLAILIVLDILQIDVDLELLVDSAAALSVLLTGLSSKLRYAAKSQGLCAAWCASILKDFSIKARKVATDHNVADLFTKAVSKFTYNTLTTLCGWVTPDCANKPRCSNYHDTPVHDEPSRCLNFVDKQGDKCKNCLADTTCRCYNGATCWDNRVVEKDLIPLTPEDKF